MSAIMADVMTMSTVPRAPGSVRVLLTEGSSLTARQTITALGRCGYVLDICDRNALCMGRFSRFVRAVYRSPAVGTDPLAYLHFMLERLAKGDYDVLLPTHEQAFMFARVCDRIPSSVGTALAPFASFMRVQSKAAFAHLLADLSLPGPPTRIVRNRAEIEAQRTFPYYLKTAYSTAGQGVWHIDTPTAQAEVIAALDTRGLLDGTTEIVLQDVAPGVLCQAVSIFARGRLIALHCTRQRAVGVGGSQSARIGVDHPIVRAHLETLGRYLDWHGPLTLDYCYDLTQEQPAYIEANPRLIEPMNGVFSGVNLAEIVVRLSLGELSGETAVMHGHVGTCSHSVLATLLGLGYRGASRRDLLSEAVRAIARRGVYRGSHEDLTPVRNDFPSIIPLSVITARLIARPRDAGAIASKAVTDYSLTPAAIQTILALDGR